jgi:hypothetical protein
LGCRRQWQFLLHLGSICVRGVIGMIHGL